MISKFIILVIGVIIITSLFQETFSLENKDVEENNVSDITTELENIKKLLNSHSESSNLSNNTGIIFGGVLGSLGLTLTIVQIWKENKRKNLEKQRIENVKKRIKRTVGNLLESLEFLENRPPSVTQLKFIPKWRYMVQTVSNLKSRVVPLMKDFDEKFYEELFGYIGFFEEQIARATGDKPVYLPSLVRTTKKIIDIHFPEFYEEREEERHAEAEFARKEFERVQKLEEEYYQKWYEENVMEGLIDEEEYIQKDDDEEDEKQKVTNSDKIIVKDGITIYPDGTRVDSHGTIL